MSDAINHPPHYKAGGVESIDVIEAFGLGFALGNAIKYILRAGRKGDRLEDLRKARWYLTREIGDDKEAVIERQKEELMRLAYRCADLERTNRTLQRSVRRWREAVQNGR